MITLILPYYRQQNMLAKQLESISKYPDGFKTVIVDDGSPEPASDVLAQFPTLTKKTGQNRDGVNSSSRVNTNNSPLSLYRINDDIPWNRSQARNIGAFVADTTWILQADIDHILHPEYAVKLLDYQLDLRRWYRFKRFRVGKADDTRRKDKIPKDAEYGEIHPHQDSYLINRDMFLSSPYDERYSGCLGGGTPFLERMKRIYGEPRTIPIPLHVYTSHAVKDASISTLSRDTKEYGRRRDTIGANDKPPRMLLHPWHKVI